MSSQYPPDEFDRAGLDMPLGMHRARPSKWRAVIPFLVILIIVPLLGWAASQYLTSRGTSEQSGANVVASAPASGAQSGSQSGAELASGGTSEGAQSGGQASSIPSPTPSETVEEVDMNVKIDVLNGSGRNGYAAQQANVLAEAGFPGTTAANAYGWNTDVSTVYYRDPALEPSAQLIADTLGISRVVNDRDAMRQSAADVAVILK